MGPYVMCITNSWWSVLWAQWGISAKGILRVGADLLCVIVNSTCQKLGLPLESRWDMGFARKGLQQIFDDGNDNNDNTSALPMWGREPRETETKPAAEVHYLPFPHCLRSLCLFIFPQSEVTLPVYLSQCYAYSFHQGCKRQSSMTILIAIEVVSWKVDLSLQVN